MDGMNSSEHLPVHWQAAVRQQALAARTSRPSSTFMLRLAMPGDAAAIARIYNESLPQAGTTHLRGSPTHTGLLPLSEERILWWLVEHRQTRRPLWVVHTGGEVVGWLSLLGFSDRPGCGGTTELPLYIGRHWRRRGVGRLLLRRALREAPLWGLDRLMAFIWHDNSASQALFRAHGFNPWGALPGVVRVGDQVLNMLIFGLEMAPAATAVRPS